MLTLDYHHIYSSIFFAKASLSIQFKFLTMP